MDQLEQLDRDSTSLIPPRDRLMSDGLAPASACSFNLRMLQRVDVETLLPDHRLDHRGEPLAQGRVTC